MIPFKMSRAGLVFALALTGLMVVQQSIWAQGGYVNVVITNTAPVTRDFLTNPLNATPNNQLSNVLHGLPDRTQVYLYRGSPPRFESHLLFGGLWYPETTIDPGEGFIIEFVTNAPISITFVGELITGTSTNTIPPGYSLRAPKIPYPFSGGVTTAYGLNPANHDWVYLWDRATQTFSPYSFSLGSWSPSEPSLQVGQSFFYHNNTSLTNNWTQTLNP